MTTVFGPRLPGSVNVSSLSRSFGDRTVLDRIQMEITAGSVTMLLGQNGSGKTTLLRILAGVLDADVGSVSIAGSPPRTGLSAFVPSGDRMLNWRLTGAQNLAFFARLAAFRGGELERTVSRVASAVDAEPLLERRVGECSMGQRRRLMIAVGFLSAAPVVLLDEPDADLDDEGRSAVDGVCRSWAEGGGVVVFASPNAVSAIASDTVIRLRDGHLEAVT